MREDGGEARRRGDMREERRGEERRDERRGRRAEEWRERIGVRGEREREGQKHLHGVGAGVDVAAVDDGLPQKGTEVSILEGYRAVSGRCATEVRGGCITTCRSSATFHGVIGSG